MCPRVGIGIIGKREPARVARRIVQLHREFHELVASESLHAQHVVRASEFQDPLEAFGGGANTVDRNQGVSRREAGTFCGTIGQHMLQTRLRASGQDRPSQTREVLLLPGKPPLSFAPSLVRSSTSTPNGASKSASGKSAVPWT